MSTDIFESKLQAMLDSLNAEIQSIINDAEDLESRAKAKRELIEEKKKEIIKFQDLINMSLEFAKYTKTLEEITTNAVSKEQVKEVFDDLETQQDPDFKSAKLELGIESFEQEDPPQREAS